MERQTVIILDVERRGEAAVVIPRGRISETVVHQLERELTRSLEQGASVIVLDMGEVPYVTSTCLGALMLAHKRARKAGGGLRVARPQPLVRQILEVTKLFKLFGVYDSVEEALAAE